MDIYTKEFTGLISYKVLSNYHFSAKMTYENCLKRNQPFEVDYTHEIDIKAANIESAKQEFIDFAMRLNNHRIFYHLSNIAYIIQNWQRLEGTFIEEDSTLHKYTKARVEQLISVVKLRDRPQGLILEVSHPKKKKDEENYVKLIDPDILSAALQASANLLLKKLKEDKNNIPFELLDELKAISEPDLEKLNSLDSKLINTTDKAFNSGLVFTICETLRKYLNEQTELNPSGVFLTNDEARIIYDVCIMYRVIIPNEDHMDFDKLNYIKAVLRNGINKGWEVSKPTITSIWTSEI
ncbi:hypothetical protein [Pedobacter sp. AJM]|uniref:hypothetical protein n=1 Tax=Pedobacter sp. AJM TaxID=2003629 RepID=UPI000B4AD723|nr:hypothetical protein [Pedobacter sp. AJM]OWK71427.1 hypothetical protein CBW18_10255 [Pedobacter sp. AJM]